MRIKNNLTLISLVLIFAFSAKLFALEDNYDEEDYDEDDIVSTETYKVVKGDTLAKISYRIYKDGKLYPYIAEANRIKNPHFILEGRILLIPPSPMGFLSNVKTLSVEPVIKDGFESEKVTEPKEEQIKQKEAMPENSKKTDDKKEQPGFKWRSVKNNVFKSNEKLKFAIAWKFVVVGYATMNVEGIVDFNDRFAYHIVSEARSAPFFDNFFKVRDINESWIDVESLCSLRFEAHISEGKYNSEEAIILDQVNHTFEILNTDKKGSIPFWVQDVLSSLYYLRTRDLEVGKEYSIDTHSGDKSWPLIAKVVKKEKVTVPAGEFECYKVEPILRENAGVFQSKGKLWVWMTADEKKVPVLMKSKIAIGSIVARLIEMDTK